jgi:hypothetical protein
LERLKAKQEHAEAVRQRKLMASANKGEGGNNAIDGGEDSDALKQQSSPAVINNDERPIRGKILDQSEGQGLAEVN